MKLPHADRALLDVTKLSDYCLSPSHPRGRHKAKVFRSALGMGPDDAVLLKKLLLRAAREEEAVMLHQDEFGRRYAVDTTLTGPAGTAVVRSLWIVLRNEEVPRFISGYVK